MSDETVEVKAVVEEEKKAPGRKPGAMKRDEEGRLLKADGSLAKTIGRKPKKTAKEPKQEKKTGKRGRPAGSKNTKKVSSTVKEPKLTKIKKVKKVEKPVKAKKAPKKTTAVKRVPVTIKTPEELIKAFEGLENQRAAFIALAAKQIQEVAGKIAACDQKEEKVLISQLHRLKELVG